MNPSPHHLICRVLVLLFCAVTGLAVLIALAILGSSLPADPLVHHADADSLLASVMMTALLGSVLTTVYALLYPPLSLLDAVEAQLYRKERLHVRDNPYTD